MEERVRGYRSQSISIVSVSHIASTPLYCCLVGGRVETVENTDEALCVAIPCKYQCPFVEQYATAFHVGLVLNVFYHTVGLGGL